MLATRTGAEGRLFRLLIGGLILVSAAAQFALVPVMPAYARRFGLSGFEQGMILGATGLASLVVSLPAGTLSDRFGARRITLAAGVLMAIATAAQALAGGLPALLAARLLFGAGYGMVWTAGLCWLAGAAAGGPPALGGSVASAGVGGVAGPAAAGALAQHLGLAVPLLVTAAGFAAITAGLAVLRVEPGPAAPRAGGLRSLLSLRATAASRDGAGLGASVGLLNLIWAVTAVIGPLAAGAAAGHLGAPAVFGLTQAACVAALGVTAALAGRARRPAAPAAGPGSRVSGWTGRPRSGVES